MTYLLPSPANYNHKPQDIGAHAELPADFDPLQYPILGRHWFGFKPIGAVAAEIVQDLTFRRKIKRLVAKGERAVGEILAELAADRNLATVIDEALDRYIDIDDAALDATGARDLPPAPLHAVEP